jgi:hypothetical protein
MLCSLLSLALPIPWSNGRLYQCTTGGGIPDTLHVKVTVSPSFVITLPVDSSSSICGGTVGKKTQTMSKVSYITYILFVFRTFLSISTLALYFCLSYNSTVLRSCIFL